MGQYHELQCIYLFIFYFLLVTKCKRRLGEGIVVGFCLPRFSRVEVSKDVLSVFCCILSRGFCTGRRDGRLGFFGKACGLLIGI